MHWTFLVVHALLLPLSGPGAPAGRRASAPSMLADESTRADRPLDVMIAGGGIGGLCTALVLQNEGHRVSVFEKTTLYRPFGGPIQVASNALESLKRIDADVYREIVKASTVIGDRKNGLKDGKSNEWFATFDLESPARARNQDVSLVIDRPILQDILLRKV